MVTASSFLGISWIVLGIIGIWQKKGDPIARHLLLWSVLAMLFSFGDQFVIPIGPKQYSFPWIWQLVDLLPGLSDMNATHRFLMAPSLVLALGVACLGRRILMVLGGVICVLEALLISPAHWPIPSKKPVLPEELSVIQKPFIFWPPPPVISSYKVTMTGLLIDQPIALFSAQGSSMPDASGKIAPLHTLLDRHGQTLNEWTQSVIDSDVNNLIQYRSFHNSNGELPLRTHPRMCYPSYCVSMLIHEVHE